jgi:hypothetical protein
MIYNVWMHHACDVHSNKKLNIIWFKLNQNENKSFAALYLAYKQRF